MAPIWFTATKFRQIRTAIFLLVLLTIALVAASDAAKASVLARHSTLTMLILMLFLLVLLPTRFCLVSIPLSYGLVLGLRAGNWLKVQVTGLPVTYLDAITIVRNPAELAHALGYKVSFWTVNIVLAAVPFLLIALILWRVRPSAIVLFQKAGCLAVITLISLAALENSGRFTERNMSRLYPDLQTKLWEPGPQRNLFDKLGPFEYLAFTWAAGDAKADEIQEAQAGAIPYDALRAVEAPYLKRAADGHGLRPNIVILHAESTFDPNFVFRLSHPVPLPLWTSGADTEALGPLAVNIIGGGSWVTEFEVVTGVAASGFGYQGFYTHQKIGPRVRMALPAFLRDRGYMTDAYYTEDASYMGVGPAFLHYGFDRFHDAKSLGLSTDWTNTDEDIIGKVIDAGAFAPTDKPRLIFMSTNENHAPHECKHFTSQANLAVEFADHGSFAANCMLNEYLRRAGSTSRAVDAVVKQLQVAEEKTGRPYVFMLYGDHQPYSMTEGQFDIAGGSATETMTQSFEPYRRGANLKTTIYHFRSSLPRTIPPKFDFPLPVTALATLVSTFAARSADDIYMPLNLLALDRCKGDWSEDHCPLGRDLKIWGQKVLFTNAMENAMATGHGQILP
ncbi:sulfatase-like hydrolase/transferase [Rhizobium leguminosarum]|uniref:sulfatase-like hydrolase/transferase n=1 Tax=Rhizobium leguminosarum TaxID=384 RepID=UPI001FED9CAC|nr:sulfatase-like hydrolase/transferase [Rhizobium leguminosarum]